MHCAAICLKITGVIAILLAPSAVFAHTGAGPADGIVHGLLHPVSGIDHIAAMAAVGLWAAQRGGRALWAVPLSFVTAMTAGSIAGAAGWAVPFVEPAIGASVLILGILIAAAARMSLSASCIVVGLCAVFHGHAHGTEIPGELSGLSYGAGFILSTLLLHAGGLIAGYTAQRYALHRLIRYAGITTTAAGICLCLF